MLQIKVWQPTKLSKFSTSVDFSPGISTVESVGVYRPSEPCEFSQKADSASKLSCQLGHLATWPLPWKLLFHRQLRGNVLIKLALPLGFVQFFWGKFSGLHSMQWKIIPFEVFLLFSPPILLGKLLHGDRLVGRGLLLHLVLEVLLAHDLQVHLRVNKEVTEIGS